MFRNCHEWQITSRIVVSRDGTTKVTSPTQHIELSHPQWMNYVLTTSNFDKPTMLGRTKTSLIIASISSKVSLQEITRVLCLIE